MKFDNLAIVGAVIVALAALGLSLAPSPCDCGAGAGGFVQSGTWVSSFNIRDDAITSAKILNYTIGNADLAATGVVNSSQLVNPKVNLSGDTLTGNINMTNNTINALYNLTFANESKAWITWNGTALIIRAT